MSENSKIDMEAKSSAYLDSISNDPEFKQAMEDDFKEFLATGRSRYCDDATLGEIAMFVKTGFQSED